MTNYQGGLPMPDPVKNKRDMYRRIVAGEFGNTLPRFFDLADWVASGRRFALWGVQHTSIAGFPGTRLDVPTAEVPARIAAGGFGADFVVSPMVHQVGRVLWEGNVCEIPGCGLVCSGNVSPAPGSWRRHMLAPRRWEGSAARVLLRSVLNPNSYADLETLLDSYPGHVVELSALDVCFGTCPDRNAVIWEVRAY